jgi:hypothetical protein
VVLHGQEFSFYRGARRRRVTPRKAPFLPRVDSNRPGRQPPSSRRLRHRSTGTGGRSPPTAAVKGSDRVTSLARHGVIRCGCDLRNWDGEGLCITEFAAKCGPISARTEPDAIVQWGPAIRNGPRPMAVGPPNSKLPER